MAAGLKKVTQWKSQPKSKYGLARTSFGNWPESPKVVKKSFGTTRKGTCRRSPHILNPLSFLNRSNDDKHEGRGMKDPKKKEPTARPDGSKS
jgi:hypothetical protein